MSLSMADVTLSGFKEPNWTYIYLFHIYMRDQVAMSGLETKGMGQGLDNTQYLTSHSKGSTEILRAVESKIYVFHHYHK